MVAEEQTTRFRIPAKRLKLVEKHLKNADELAAQTVMPVQQSGGANTEQRWLSRMVTNATKEVKARVESAGSSQAKGGAVPLLPEEEDPEDALATIMAGRKELKEKLSSLREEKAQLEKRVGAIKARVQEACRERCRQQQRARRPTEGGESEGAGVTEGGTAAAGEEGGAGPGRRKSGGAGPGRRKSGAATATVDDVVDVRMLTILRTKSKRIADQFSELGDSMPKRYKSLSETTKAVRDWMEEDPNRLVDRALMQEAPKAPHRSTPAAPPPLAPNSTTSSSNSNNHNSNKATAAAVSSTASSSSSSSFRCFTPAGLLAQQLMQQQQQTR